MLPTSIVEFYMSREDVIAHRVAGALQKQIIPIIQESLDKVFVAYSHKYVSILFFKNQINFVTKLIAKCKYPVCRVCVDDSRLSDIKIENLSRISLFKFFNQNGLLPNNEKKFVKWKKFKVKLNFYGHMSFNPAINSLKQFNYYGNKIPYFTSIIKDDYSKKICEYAELIRSIRNRFHPKKSYSPSLIISAPSMGRWLYSKYYYSKDDVGIKKVLKAIRNQDAFIIELNDNDKHEFLRNSWLPIFKVRRDEAASYAAAISCLACNSFTPVYRFPYGVNSIRPDLVRFGGCARGNGIHRGWKLNKIRKSISNSINSFSCDGFRNLMRETTGHIKIAGDVPFEFLEINKVPLSVEHDVSRVPTAAGNSFLQQVLFNDHQYIQRKELQRVLVIRSFQSSDPIRKYLSVALETLDLEGRVSVDYKDISTVDDFVDALNQFTGHILIYDGHGGYDPSSWISYLIIGSEKVDYIIYVDLFAYLKL